MKQSGRIWPGMIFILPAKKDVAAAAAIWKFHLTI
jgi:hypothetical protein